MSAESTDNSLVDILLFFIAFFLLVRNEIACLNDIYNDKIS